MLKEIFKVLSVLLYAAGLSAADDLDAAITARFVTAVDLAFLGKQDSDFTADDIAARTLMTTAHEIVAATPGFDHLIDPGKWNANLAGVQLPRVAPDAIRMMLFFKGSELCGVGAGGMMPLSVSPVHLDVPTTPVGSDGRVAVTAPVSLKFVPGQEAIAAQYRSLVVSQGITPAEQYNAGTPGSWSITNAFASTVTIATPLGYGADFVTMHAAFFEACKGKKLANGQTPILHVCTLANREGADANFSATNLKVYPGPFKYYPGDNDRGQRHMLVGGYNKPLP